MFTDDLALREESKHGVKEVFERRRSFIGPSRVLTQCEPDHYSIVNILDKLPEEGNGNRRATSTDWVVHPYVVLCPKLMMINFDCFKDVLYRVFVLNS